MSEANNWGLTLPRREPASDLSIETYGGSLLEILLLHANLAQFGRATVL